MRFEPAPPRMIPSTGIRSVLAELAETVKFSAAVSRSWTTNKIRDEGVSSIRLTFCCRIALIVGGPTRKIKLWLSAAPLGSVTITVIVASPERFGAGVTATVRSFPARPKTIFPGGTNVSSEEVAEKVRSVAGDSRSPTMKPSGPAVVFLGTVWGAKPERNGAVLSLGEAVASTRAPKSAFWPLERTSKVQPAGSFSQKSG